MSVSLDPNSLLIGFAAAALIALILLLWLLPRARRRAVEAIEPQRRELQAALAATEKAAEAQRERAEDAVREQAVLHSRVATLDEQNGQLRADLSRTRSDADGLQRQLTDATVRSEERLRAADEKLMALQRLQEQLKPEFENLANRLLEEKAKNLKQQSFEQLGGLLNPLRERIEGFQKQVAESYGNERLQQHSLKEEIKQLRELNIRLSDEADSLAKALRGQQKIQGDWGEMVLERVLEASGLTPGRDFETQQSLRDEDGALWRPDVVVHLPEGRDLVIDAKVSLTAYIRAANATDDAERMAAMREHVDSLRAHIRGLAARDYSRLPGVRSPDFVLMFVPVEPALLDALREADDLQDAALRGNVSLVGPSNLLLALRTVANLWRLEKQNRNAQDIASRAGLLYDKFVGFVDDLHGIDKNLRQAQGAYDAAYAKLSTGHGNLLRQVEMLRKLGVEPRKRLPGGSGDEDDEAADDPVNGISSG